MVIYVVPFDMTAQIIYSLLVLNNISNLDFRLFCYNNLIPVEVLEDVGQVAHVVHDPLLVQGFP